MVADMFFTRPEIAERFAAWVKSQPFFSEVTRIIDPAAGARALSRHFPGAQEYDLHPWADTTTQADFLKVSLEYQPGTLVVMNPPFGQRSGLAVAFFNKAASIGDYVAQIVPRTFRRSSIQNRLDRDFRLVDEWVLPPRSFYLPAEGEVRPYDVPAVAQIWARTDTPREKEVDQVEPRSFRFVRTPQEATFAFRRKGRRAGEVVTQDIEATNPNSFYYIDGDPAPFQQADWSGYGRDMMGARSITKAEIVREIDG